MTTELDERTEEIRLAGNLGLWFVIVLTAVLLVHPFGTTELYDDGHQFLEHVDALWVSIHFVAAVLFLGILLPIGAWARHLGNPRARSIGRLAFYVAIAGTTVGLIHLTATDTTTFLAFADTFEAGGGNELVDLGADLLLRLHAATFVAWVTSYFFALPVVLGWAAAADGRFPAWYPWLAWVAAALAGISAVLTLMGGQLTTLSEMGIFRPSVTLYLVWLLVTTWWMRRGTVLRASPAD
ncbi:MAG TPA: hypothetical protein VF115_02590 [Acidimicrobiia bacterium]